MRLIDNYAHQERRRARRVAGPIIMRMNTVLFFWPVLVVSLSIVPQSVFAEAVTCRTEIFYEWQREGDAKPRKELWILLSQEGDDAEKVKATLQRYSALEKSKAMEQCSRQHEQLSSCVAGKLSKYRATMSQLDFSARELLKESVQKECDKLTGECVGATTSAFLCIKRKVDEEPAEGEDGEKKDGED